MAARTTKNEAGESLSTFFALMVPFHPRPPAVMIAFVARSQGLHDSSDLMDWRLLVVVLASGDELSARVESVLMPLRTFTCLPLLPTAVAELRFAETPVNGQQGFLPSIRNDPT